MPNTIPINEEQLLARLRTGDTQAVGALYEQHRDRLRRMVLLRLDARVQARVDASDVLQEVFLQVMGKVNAWITDPSIPFFLWLRLITGERIIQLHRMHLDAAKRTAKREISLQQAQVPEAGSCWMASQLAGSFTSADREILRAELQAKLEEVLNTMDRDDREVVAMRHFEELTTEEIATLLGISRSGVLKRYTRAIRRLRKAFELHMDLSQAPFE